MKATKGKANPAMVDQLLKKLIDEGERKQLRA
jgi:Asp-tRNA(Asn)/Glu-tRNA(Gln) amidotransferase B subunit